MALTLWAPSHRLFPSSAPPSIARPQSSTVSPPPPLVLKSMCFLNA